MEEATADADTAGGAVRGDACGGGGGGGVGTAALPDAPCKQAHATANHQSEKPHMR